MAVNLYDLHERMSLSLYSLVNLQLMAGFAGAWLICYPLYVMVVRRPERLVRHMIDDFRVNVLTVDRVVGALVVAAFLPAFLSVFTGFKTMIGVVNPFAWEPGMPPSRPGTAGSTSAGIPGRSFIPCWPSRG
jgi:hypothetical protein